MKKILAIVTLLTALLASNVADAKYSDEYKAQHPSRVKTQKTITASGRAAIFTRYKLFSRWFGDGLLELTVSDCNDIKICTICYRVSGHSPREFVNFTWGNLDNIHEKRVVDRPPFFYNLFFYSTIKTSPFKYPPSGWKMLMGWSAGCES